MTSSDSAASQKPEASIALEINGDSTTVATGTTLAGLVEQLGKDPRTVAVEHNGTIVPRATYAQVVLAAGDCLEIVHFVQGGAPSQGDS